ncbi:hypothetical protein [Streptomyces xanthophaeus]|uniref:hypothetical protein n=1 Tax=Streptomyces xanthophaeus TaxID=67385 RepID=UPI0036584805
MALAEISEERRIAICAWLTEQGIDPHTVPIDTMFEFTPAEDGVACTLHYDAYVREDGRLKCDPRTREPLRVECLHRVIGPPPEFPL